MIRAAVAAFMGILMACAPSRADDKETLKLMLVNGGAIIGQAIACNVSRDRVLKVMTAQAATIEVLSNRDAKAMKLRDDIIRLAAENEKSQPVPRCETIETAFSGFEKKLKDLGLMR
ncbi:MAG: hypothetical protein HZA68_09915 [Rhodovulum sp.]|nr:hypothetical protein [Rhodovulum sp.]